MTCITCEVKRANMIASVMMLGKPRHSEPAWNAVVSKLNATYGQNTHYIKEFDNGEFWLVRVHPVTHTELKVKRSA